MLQIETTGIVPAPTDTHVVIAGPHSLKICVWSGTDTEQGVQAAQQAYEQYPDHRVCLVEIATGDTLWGDCKNI
jgi:hypothetical protein